MANAPQRAPGPPRTRVRWTPFSWSTPLTERAWKGTFWFASGSILHTCSIPIELALLKMGAEASMRREVTWSEILAVMEITRVLFFGIIFQALFALAAASATARGLRGVRPSLVGILLGALGALISLVVFGGYAGALAGLLVVTGGFLGWFSAPRQFFHHQHPGQ